MRIRSLNRREFLAASAFVPPPFSANDAIGVLAIGVRGRGRGIGVAAGKYGRVVAACDVDEANYARLFENLDEQQPKRPDLYKDYRQALERKDVDVVTIGTPDHWHTRILLDALKAGKDVYCEKPMTLTIDEGKQICRAVRESGRVVAVGTQQRSEFKRMFLKAVVLARSERLGQKLKATCFIGTGAAGGPFTAADPPSTLDWDLWQGQTKPAAFYPERCHGTFRWWFHYSGGKMTDWGAHHIDIAQWALGCENTGPVEIKGKGKFPLGRKKTLQLVKGEIGLDDVPPVYHTATEFNITLKYANGNEIVVRNGPGNGIDLRGKNGRIFVNRKSLTGKLVTEIENSQDETDRLEQEVIRLYNGKEPTTHMADFIDCVRTRKTPVSDVFSHQRSVSSCHLANLAILCGRKLRWDPEREDFIRDAEASSMLSREQRAPYQTRV